MEQILLTTLELFARAGGGGSGGSSGGSGGGSSILILIGYLPPHLFGSMLRRRLLNNQELVLLAHILGWSAASAWAVLCLVIFRGGFFGVATAALAFAGMSSGLFGWFEKLKQSTAVKNQLQRSAAQDAAWSEQQLTEYAKQVFLRYQYDWSRQDLESMKTYMTERYHRHAALFIRNLQQLQRANSVENVLIIEALIVQAYDSPNNAEDTVVVGFTANAADKLENLQTQQNIFTDRSAFTEYWTFRRSGSTWLLDDISQATADMAAYNRHLAELAARNNYYYSVDMGWLFIPERGQLFGKAKFGVSDVNNHVIGLYKESLLVQLYTYSAFEKAKPRVIAQVNVPKTYGNIVVRRKKGAPRLDKRGLVRVETEWIQFNQQYEVYATNTEQATSFELLNPTYMEQLAALPFAVSIEVVDNVIYLYTDECGTDAATYETMLDLMHKAFKEMRL